MMLDSAKSGVSVMSRAAALQSQYLEQALANLSNPELTAIQQDIATLEARGVWSTRIVDLMTRAKCIADAENILARFEAA